MPIRTIEFKGDIYPEFQASGNAARFVRAFAQEFCKGENGLDIGYCKNEWRYPGAAGIDPGINKEYDAMNLPYNPEKWDYIHSSHCLEHVKESWTNVLDYWLSNIKSTGILFLYLPHISQKYWNIDSNRKHVHQFTGDEIYNYLSTHEQVKIVFKSGVDLNNSFIIVAEKI